MQRRKLFSYSWCFLSFFLILSSHLSLSFGISSPFQGGFGDFAKPGKAQLRYMPIWSLEEAEKCFDALLENRFDKDVLRDRFKHWGGSAWPLFKAQEEVVSLRVLYQAVAASNDKELAFLRLKHLKR